MINQELAQLIAAEREIMYTILRVLFAVALALAGIFIIAFSTNHEALGWSLFWFGIGTAILTLFFTPLLRLVFWLLGRYK